MELEVYNESQIQKIQTLSGKLAESQIVPKALRGKPGDIFIVLQTGYEMGIPPMRALNLIDVIEGRTAIKPQYLLSQVYSQFPEAKITWECDEVELSVELTMTRGVNSYTSIWDKARAVKAGLFGKYNWAKQPTTMMRWRAVSECCRFLYPEIASGLYTPEEMESVSSVASGVEAGGAKDLNNIVEAELAGKHQDIPEEVKKKIEEHCELTIGQQIEAARSRVELERIYLTMTPADKDLHLPDFNNAMRALEEAKDEQKSREDS